MGRESENEAKPGDLPYKTDQSFLRGLRNGDVDVFFQFPKRFHGYLFSEEIVFCFFIKTKKEGFI